MYNKDSLGDRMKEYERRNQYWLQCRTPVAIRVDMKAGHSFTKGFKRPFDEIFIKSIQETAKYMCENIQGAVLSYQQSDEITIILQDYATFETDAWFGYRTDKVCSISASMATLAFNQFFYSNVLDWYAKCLTLSLEEEREVVAQLKIYKNASEKGAMFDARCFNIPKEEVANLIYWRQLDATRNSIQMVGQANFSHKELQNKSCNDIQDMLMLEKDINWNNFPTAQKRGSCCVKKEVPCTDRLIGYKTEWVIDTEIPIFKGEDRKYIEELI
jgi:tRNA(His) 5'-end guanylyltransferase